MNKSDLLQKAKYIQFPLLNGNYKQYSTDYKIIQLPLISEDQYKSSYPLNEHHIKPLSLFNKVMPIIDDIFNINFNQNDFNIEIIQDSRYNKEIPMPIAKNDYSFDCISLFRNEDAFYNITYKDLLITASKDARTRWHQLYKFGHECSILDNKTNCNGRKLIIIGDSQMIPLVTMLSIYFQHITYIDNRKNYPIFDKIKNIEYTDVLINLFMTPIHVLHNYLKET